MSQSPQQESASKSYQDAWRAVNILIRSDGSWSGRERGVCYLNQGDGGFLDAAFVSGLDLPADGRSFAPIDLDGDGDLDLVLKNRSGTQLRAFRNDFRAAPRMLRFGVRGTESNHDGVGARLTLETDRRRLVREIVSGSGYLSQRPRLAEFGLLPGETPRRLRVAWPGGGSSDFANVPVESARLLAVEGDAALQPWSSENTDGLVDEPEKASPRPGVRLAESVPAPRLELEALDGARVSIPGSAGRKTLVNFWATWCPPCRKELADLAANTVQLSEAGVDILAISVDDPADRAKVGGFAKEFQLPFPILLADDEAVNAYTILQHNLLDRRTDLAIPTTFLLNEAGEVEMLYRGEVEASVVLADLQGGPAEPFAGRWVRSGPDRDFVALGASYAERGLAAHAIEAFEAAWNKGVRSPELANNLAGALVQTGRLDRAEELLRGALDANPNDLDAAANLASLLLKKGEFSSAYEQARRVAAARADDIAALVVQGSAAFALGRPQEAEQLYRRAIEMAPERPEPHENLAGLLASTERLEPAIASYEQAVELGASSAKLFSNLGVLHMRTGSPARGLAAFRKAAEVDPDDYGANLNLALYYTQNGAVRIAREWAVKARTADPSQPGAYLVEAQAAAAAGDRPGARAVIELLLERHPDSTEGKQALEALTP